MDLTLLNQGHVAQRFASIFKLHLEKYEKYHPAGLITKELRRLLRVGTSIINQAFPAKVRRDESDDESDERSEWTSTEDQEGCLADVDQPEQAEALDHPEKGIRLWVCCRGSHEHAHHDEGVPYFTLMCVEADTLPWSGMKQWVKFALPAVDMSEATEAWRNATD